MIVISRRLGNDILFIIESICRCVISVSYHISFPFHHLQVPFSSARRSVCLYSIVDYLPFPSLRIYNFDTFFSSLDAFHSLLCVFLVVSTYLYFSVIMSFEHKGPASASEFEVDPRDLTYQRHHATIRFLNGVRVGLTSLALVSGITILGTAANALMVYNNTHVSSDFHLALWPDEFDLRPTVALVVGSSLVIVANLVSLIFSKAKAVSVYIISSTVIFHHFL